MIRRSWLRGDVARIEGGEIPGAAVVSRGAAQRPHSRAKAGDREVAGCRKSGRRRHKAAGGITVARSLDGLYRADGEAARAGPC